MEQRLATQLKDLILKKTVGMWWEAWLCPVTALGVVKCKVNIVKFVSINSSKSHWILKLYVSVVNFYLCLVLCCQLHKLVPHLFVLLVPYF